MASIHKEMFVDAAPDQVWSAFRDVGAVHTRLAKGFVTDTRLEGDTRTVTFVNGIVARERIIDIDDVRRRLAYSVVEGGRRIITRPSTCFPKARAVESSGSPTFCRMNSRM
jgi:hypothetical protein